MSLVADGADMLKAAARASDEGFTAARTTVEETLRSARDALADASRPVFDKTRETAAVADDYVRGSPWIAVGVAIAVGVLIGFLAAKR